MKTVDLHCPHCDYFLGKAGRWERKVCPNCMELVVFFREGEKMYWLKVLDQEDAREESEYSE